jgi:pimeloyl-ACP methyl ester carboxylesterase
METTTSKDGTTLAFDRRGEGPPVVVVGGASVDRAAGAGLSSELAPDFTVLNHDRRGRGDSGDTPPYAVDREIEDVMAMLDAAGGSAVLFGSSSGAALALKAVVAGAPATKLVLWEPPFIPEGEPRPPADTASISRAFVDEGRRSDAVEFFMSKVVGLPPEVVEQAKTSPVWAQQEAIAHTLAYDAEIMGDYELPAEDAATVTVPTLVMAGDASFPWMAVTASALADAMPNGEFRLLEGQSHGASPEALGAAVRAFVRA